MRLPLPVGSEEFYKERLPGARAIVVITLDAKGDLVWDSTVSKTVTKHLLWAALDEHFDRSEEM